MIIAERDFMEIQSRAEKIKLLILDVDGVLTNGRIVINDRGEEIKAFHVRDGQGLRQLMGAGIEVVLITGRSSKALTHRAEDLGIREIHQGVKDKDALLKKITLEKQCRQDQVCCVGDDLPDIPMFRHAGLRVAVSDAVPEVKAASNWVTRLKGGEGAVREVCELILKSQGKWPHFGTEEK
jgi:3-deoxy-D-manno-octulosonate 8-phosphate phosphatase (KDO 8-P phosphatase)